MDYTDRAGNTVVARFTADDPASDTPSLVGPQVVFTAKQPYANHNGGCVAFAPDGTLWVGMGDGGSAGDPAGNAQNPDSLLGKILSLPVENPGAGKGRVTPRTVAIGLRNPWRFSFDPEGQDVWIGDVGQDLWEEVDLVPMDQIQGANFGWDLWEGDHPYPPEAKPARDGYVFPVVEYGREDGASVTGGHVYRGQQYPALDGVYVFGDFVSGKIWVARESSAGRSKALWHSPTRVSLPRRSVSARTASSTSATTTAPSCRSPPASLGRSVDAMPSPGEIAPPIRAAITGGGEFDLAAQQGRWVVVFFYVRANTPG